MTHDRTTTATPRATPDAVAHHATDDHGDDHGHDDHAHGEEPLGPIDVAAWGAGVLGIGSGSVVAACFAIATGLG